MQPETAARLASPDLRESSSPSRKPSTKAAGLNKNKKRDLGGGEGFCVRIIFRLRLRSAGNYRLRGIH
jgi:hypothetical protein